MYLLAALFIKGIVGDVNLTDGFEYSPRLPVNAPRRPYYRSELSIVTINTIRTAIKYILCG